MERIADEAALTEPQVAPSRLKAKVYSALMLRQAESGPLMSLTETDACGHKLCVFEELVATASNSDFHQLLEQDELRRNTRRVLASLPEQYRLALIWRYWEKSSAREMALKTGKTEKAIERLLARARAEFRERWNHAQSS